MSRPAGPVRQALLKCLKGGMSGTYRSFAAVVGVEPDTARATLKEIRRAGQASGQCRQHGSGRAGAAPAVYGRHEPTMDALGYVRQVWR